MGNKSIKPPRTAYSPGLTTWRDVAVARQRQLGFEFGFVQLLLDLELKGVAGQKTGRRQPVQRGGGGDDDDVGAAVLVALADAPQRGQTFADQILVRRKRVVGQGFPVGEQRASALRGRKRRSRASAAGRRWRRR